MNLAQGTRTKQGTRFLNCLFIRDLSFFVITIGRIGGTYLDSHDALKTRGLRLQGLGFRYHRIRWGILHPGDDTFARHNKLYQLRVHGHGTQRALMFINGKQGLYCRVSGLFS